MRYGLTGPERPKRTHWARRILSALTGGARPEDSARVTADALDALGRAEEAKALREQYGVTSSDETKPS
jgi:hypothetical protein